jgi:zinc-ribbon domain
MFSNLTNVLYTLCTKCFQLLGARKMVQNQVQNPPSAAYWLSMIGAVIGLLAGLLLIGAGAFLGVFTFGIGFIGLGGLGIWMLIASTLVIIFAGKLKANPMEHTKWGVLILVFSLLGVGGILGFIGGILAIIYNPVPVGAQAQYAPPPPQAGYAQTQAQSSTRVCPQCGRIVQANERFCPNCGKQLY